ncbi:hypothetical protein ERHA55_29520 [Erwinia rhapontici]|uniref:Recombinase domain-containing protein n=2 Tax=Erwinia rhapontici TaxID=55212 RepID=A0ABM7N1E3_ERWRD|nr:hypothetical protein ERHA53_26240 [Erwinia rhapontici]BCQ45425.1 hypothetical protein ERHA55_29520 [Erwinia rhapontici]
MSYINSMPQHFDISRLVIIKDEGVSSFKGDNLLEGMPLRDFVQGCIERQDGNRHSLIVYSVDRISRMNVWVSTQFVAQTIMSGIEIHDLMTRQVLKADDQIGAIISTLNLIRANSESEAKSIRRRDSIESSLRRSLETGKAMPGKVPKWLKIVDETYVVEERIASCIRDSVDWYIEGQTSGQIVNRLNNTGRLYGEMLWSAAFLIKTLKSKTLIGTYTRTKDGEPVQYENFYPAIVNEEKFNLVNKIIRNIGKKFIAKTRVDKGRVVNILSGMLFCGSCGGVVHINRTSERLKYFYCSNNYGRKICKSPKGNFLTLERVLLSHLKDFDLNTIVNSPDNHERKLVEADLSEARGVVRTIEASIASRKESGKLVLVEMLEALADAREQTERLVSRLENEFSSFEVPTIDYDINSIVQDTNSERGKIHRELSTIIDNVKISRFSSFNLMIITYRNAHKHVIMFENKTGNVLHAIFTTEELIEVFGGSSEYKHIVEGEAVMLADGYERMKRKNSQ